MSHAHDSHGSHDAGHAHHGAGHEPAFYIRIWAILCALLVVSVLGPMLEITIVTLITAFGIAFVKAYLVAKNFMHLDVERPIVHYALITSLAFMVLFFAAVSPDVMNHEGTRWENVAAKHEIERALREGEGDHGGHGGAAEGGHGGATEAGHEGAAHEGAASGDAHGEPAASGGGAH